MRCSDETVFFAAGVDFNARFRLSSIKSHGRAVFVVGATFSRKGQMESQERIRELISECCGEIRDLLLEKNRKYGNSALAPIRVFSRSDVDEQLNVRIDDKLSRLRNRADDEDEDVVKDLAGYLVLKMVAGKIARTGE